MGEKEQVREVEPLKRNLRYCLRTRLFIRSLANHIVLELVIVKDDWKNELEVER